MFASELAYHARALPCAGRHILHLDASHGQHSLVAHGACMLFKELAKSRPDLTVEHMNLWDQSTRAKMEYNLGHVRAKMAALGSSASEDDLASFAGIEELASTAASASGLVVSAPLWNYGAPYVLKQYFDCILHPGLTFRETPSGPQGLLGRGRPVVLITSSGSTGGKDHLTPWLKDIASMMGFTDYVIVAVESIAHGEREKLMDAIAADAVEAGRHLSSVAPANAKDWLEAPAAMVPPTATDMLDAEAKDEEEKKEEEEQEEENILSEQAGKVEVLGWLRAQGGLSDDGLETLECVGLNGELLYRASVDDWRNEELGLEDADVDRLLALQGRLHAATRAHAAAATRESLG